VIQRTLMSPRFQRQAREGSWIIAGQIIAILGTLVLVRVLTEYLEPAQYGQLALGLTVAGLVNQVVMGGLANGIGRFYSIAAEANDLPGYLADSRQMMKYATAVVAAFALVFLTGLRWLDYSQWIGLAAAAFLLSILSGYNETLSGIQNAARQRAIVAFHKGLDAWLKIFLAIGMMLWLGISSMAAVLGYALSSLLVTVSQIFFLRRLIRPQSKTVQATANWSRQIWLNSWPYSTWGVFTWAQQSSDRWALAHYASTDEVGAYVVLIQIGMVPIITATGMLIALIAPILFQRVGNAEDHVRVMEGYAITRNVTIVAMIAIAFFAVTSTMLHEQIFDYLVNERYHKYSYLMPWLVVAAGLQSCHHILAIRISAMLKVRSIVIPQIISALVFVLLNVIGAFLGGVEGLVYSQLVASFIYFSWMLVLTEVHRHRYAT
jgi:O-antigen/teichoic acid export membrane protein